MSNAIEVHDIVKTFGDFTAVKGITFDVKAGEIFGLLGPNGAGKSTLIRMMVTLLPPTSGTATINGFDVVKKADEVRRSIGVIPQAMTSDLELTVVREPVDLREAVWRAARQAHAADRGAARGRRADAVGGQAGEEPVGRHAAPRRDRARPRARAAGLLSRRADHRARPGLAHRGLGHAAARSSRSAT